MADTPLYVPVLEEQKLFQDYRQEIRGDSFNWWRLRNWDLIKYLAIHHSDTKPTSNKKSDVDYIAYLHCEPKPKGRGWGGVGYHFIITDDGTVWYVGDISLSRANVADMNDFVIGICLVGQFTQYNPTDAQILSAHDLCKYLLNDVPALTSLKGWESVVGHQELQATQCPGSSWKVSDSSMYERIKNRIPYNPPSAPEPVIDWEDKYKKFKLLKDGEVAGLNEQISELTALKTTCETNLANKKIDCQKKLKVLQEKLDNANSENPKIPTLADFPENEVLGRAGEILVDKLTGIFRPIYDKLKNTNGQRK